jgi:hypothetical protein
MLGMSDSRVVNQVHNAMIMNLSRFRENLKVLIDQPIWDHVCKQIIVMWLK